MKSAFFPDHPELSVQTIRLIAQVAYGGADYFDAAAAAARIDPEDPESWQAEWRDLGARVERRAQEALDASHGQAALRHFLHAGSYYRQSDFFLPGRDPRKKELFLKARACFLEAARLYDPPIETIEVPCGGERYRGYFHAPSAGPLPAVLLLGGADSLAEELFVLAGPELARRNIALMLVDTPGRGSTLRVDGIPTRPDYEVPVSAAVDSLAARPEVDPSRIGLLGISLGGYYAPRAAGFDDRFRAMVLWCGCFDVLADLYAFYPPIQSQMQWILGVDSDAEARDRLAAFNLRGIAGRISCPTLVSHAEGDALMDPAGARKLYEEIACADKELRLWPKEAGGAVHCNWDSLSVALPYMLDWLADRL